MGAPIYDGNVHPGEYIKKMRLYCKFRQITEEQEILELAKMSVDSTINIPENITSFDALINALKEHISFTVFKNSCKRKLQALKYEDDGDTVNFITNFVKLCRDAEITDLVEQKKYLINALPNSFVKDEFTKKQKNVNSTNELIMMNEFTKKQKKVNSTEELIKLFEESVLEDSRIIRDGSIVALKHVTTGKYLSSCDKKYPPRNNNNNNFGNFGLANAFSNVSVDHDYNMVYCDDFGPNALWSIHTTPTLPQKSQDTPTTTQSIFGQPTQQAGGFGFGQPTQPRATFGFGQTTQPSGPSVTFGFKRETTQDSPQKLKSSSFIKYKSSIRLEHQIFSKCLDTNTSRQSPMSNHFEVCCGDDQSSWIIHNQDNNQGNVNSQDIILLQHNRQQQSAGFGLLRSHDVRFTIENEDYQEVVTHDQIIGGNDQWCIELVKQK